MKTEVRRGGKEEVDGPDVIVIAGVGWSGKYFEGVVTEKGLISVSRQRERRGAVMPGPRKLMRPRSELNRNRCAVMGIEY